MLSKRCLVFACIFYLLIGCQKEKSFEANPDYELAYEMSESFKNFQIDDAQRLREKLDSRIISEYFEFSVKTLTSENELDNSLFQYLNVKKEPFEEFLLYRGVGQSLKMASEDSLSLVYLKKAERLAYDYGNEYWQFQINQQLADFYTKHYSAGKNRDLFIHYLERVDSYNGDDIDRYKQLSLNLFSAIYQFIRGEITEKEFPTDIFTQIESLNIEEPMIWGMYHQYKNIYYALVKKDYAQADKESELAFLNYQKSKLPKAKEQVFQIKFNQTQDLVDAGDYSRAKEKMQEMLSADLDGSKNYWALEKVHLDLSEVYKKLGDAEQSRYHLLQSGIYKDSLEETELAKSIYATELKFNVEQKEQEIENLSKSKNFFQKNFFFLLPLALLLGFLTYLFRKRYQTSNSEKQLIQQEYEVVQQEKDELQTDFDVIAEKNQALEDEKAQTIERLKELKEVVTKDFIILQDKSKVYVEELMYIKSDDHYLRVHLHEKKDNFVRGKLSTIIKELPPNFKRCHRSYIVNENYIKRIDSKALTLVDGSEVPISKTYKAQFEA